MSAASAMSRTETPVATPSAAPATNSVSTATSASTASATSNVTPFLSLAGAPAALPSGSSFAPGPLAGGLFLALLAAAALVMARRRRRTTRLIEIVESASLGPKRALVVARLGDELLVLGSSEAGIALLSTRPAAGLVSESTRETSATSARPEQPITPLDRRHTGAASAARSEARPVAPSGGLPLPRALELLSRLKRRVRSPARRQFETVLTESLEDVELRRKLAAGLAAQTGRPTRSAP